MTVIPEEAATRSAVQFARDVRKAHARVTPKDDKHRVSEITEALLRLKTAMRPVRRGLNREAYKPGTQNNLERRERLIELSQELQRERRKLWKMQDR